MRTIRLLPAAMLAALASCTHDGTAPRAVAQLVISAPATTTAGVDIAPGFTVTAMDAGGAVVASFSGAITVKLGANPGRATLTGTTTVNATAGVATFDNISLDKADTGYTFDANTSSLSSGGSPSFTIVAAAPATMTKSGGDAQAGLISTGVPVNPAVTIRDKYGNAVPGASVSWAIASGGGAIAAATSTTNESGVAVIQWTLGPGLGVQSVNATATGLTGSPVSFTDTATEFAFRSVSGGQYVTCGLGQSGTSTEAFCWGFGGDGESGDSTVGSHAVAYPVAGGLSFASISTGVFHTCGVTTEGAGYCWGDNGSGESTPPGELGDGTMIQRHVPTLIAGGIRFQSISAGLGTCGLSMAGAAYCWGDNDDGAVGDGTTTDRLVPTAVTTGLYAFVQLWTSRSHSCGLTSAGVAYCWGGAGFGEVGDGTITTRLTPTVVSGNLTFTSLVGGTYYTCGLVAGGQAYCWGNNSNGALGDGTTTTRLVPTPVTGGIAFTSLTAGEHTCGLTAAGVAYCWGLNQYGELGDGTTTTRLVPTAVAGGIAFASIAAGVDHTCGRTSANVLYCWGRNDHAQLGITTSAPFTNQSVPALVIP